MKIKLAGLALFLVGFILISTGSIQAQERQWRQDRSIVQISPSVYRWGSDGHYGAYIVNSAGIIVVDGHPCGSGTMEWLKGGACQQAWRASQVRGAQS